MGWYMCKLRGVLNWYLKGSSIGAPLCREAPLPRQLRTNFQAGASETLAAIPVDFSAFHFHTWCWTDSAWWEFNWGLWPLLPLSYEPWYHSAVMFDRFQRAPLSHDAERLKSGLQEGFVIFWQRKKYLARFCRMIHLFVKKWRLLEEKFSKYDTIVISLQNNHIV